MAEIFPTKVVDFESLGALLGPGAPDPDLLRFVLKLNVQDNASSIQIPYVFWSDVQKVLKFLMFLTLTFPWPRSELTIQAPNDFGLDFKVPWEQLLVQ